MYLIWFGFAVFFTPSELGPPEQPHLKMSQKTMDSFPPGFLIGCASSAYQIEGGWDADGKGESVWDTLAHTRPELFHNKDNGDVACDSYHRYKEDVQYLKYLGVTHYRFSLSWPRILPTGYDNNINEAGVDYYHNLIDELMNNGIIPVVTIFHWDLPKDFQELGGWANPLMADYFLQYAKVVFKEFGDKVKWWITINEPFNIAMGYGEAMIAPALNQHGVADYLVAHTLLRAHAKVYHLYDSEFRSSQKGKIGISLSGEFAFPLNNTAEDKLAAISSMQFEIGIYAHPIFSKEGDYPTSVRALVDSNSKKEKRFTSRLPIFTKEEIQSIKGSADFFGLNHYLSRYAAAGLQGLDPSWSRDSMAILSSNASWKTGSNGFYVVPQGFRGVLNFIRTQYDNPPVFVTENGYSSDADLTDWDRIQFFHDYMEEMLKAVYEDGCNVFGYTAWSCMDDLEWFSGYAPKFGFYHVDFNSTNRLRKKKLSADYFKKLIKTNRIPKILNSEDET